MASGESNPYKMVWTGQRRSSPIEYQPVNSRGVRYSRTNSKKNYRGSTQQSTGRIRVTTPMTARNSNSSYTTNRANGNGRTTSSTTGESQRRR
jgi:hypothetical protein